jgi:hypothetical protein
MFPSQMQHNILTYLSIAKVPSSIAAYFAETVPVYEECRLLVCSKVSVERIASITRVTRIGEQ